jgi:hypothetical protein
MKRDEILDTAKALINGDRAKDYGDADLNHQRIADGWNIILQSALDTHGYFTPMHVALMMDWVKTSRLLNTLDHSDSWVDKAAYSALGGEFAASAKLRSEQFNAK